MGDPADLKESEERGSIPALFLRQVKEHPCRTAVKSGDRSLSYEELNRYADAVGRNILDRLGDGQVPVAILLGQGIAQTASILGILKCGKIYLSLDPSFPGARLEHMLEDSGAGLIVTDEGNLPLARKLNNHKVSILNLDGIGGERPAKLPEPVIPLEAIANIFYTSGTTGKPKGVMQSHRNVLHNVEDVSDHYGLTPEDRLALLISPGFAASQTPLFGALLNGACLLPYSLGGEGLLHLAGWLMEERITFYLSVSSTFRRFAEGLTGRESFPDLRLIVVGGEPVTKRDVELYRENFADHCLFVVRLASTETFRMRTFPVDKTTGIPGPRVPVGYPVRDKEILILDEEGREAGFDRVGEITVRSRYLSPGYWNDPDLTRAHFRPVPGKEWEREFKTGNLGLLHPDDCLEFLGRKDQQVKVRGFRVEPVEIEEALLGIGSVGEAAVTALESAPGEVTLAAYIVPATDPGPSVESLRRELEKTLPDYMIPAHFITLAVLPLTPTGKLDRRELPSPGEIRPNLETPYLAPRIERERQLAEIWENILGVSPVGVRDAFSDLGADSFDHVLLSLEVEKRFGERVPLERFLEAPTVEKLAGLLSPAPETPAGTGEPEHPDHPWSTITFTGLEHNPPLTRMLKGVIFFILEKFNRLYPYSFMSRICYRLCGRPWFRSLFFRHRLSPLRRFMAMSGRSHDEEEVIRLSCFARCLRDLRRAVLSRMPPERFAGLTEFRGIPILTEALEKGKGVILLNSHYGIGHMDMLMLDRLGIDHVLTVGGWPSRMEQYGLKRWNQIKINEKALSPEALSLFGPFSLSQARPFLERGGIVRVAADDLFGTGGPTMTFLGRRRPFRKGFAEMAVLTGAAVIPVYSGIEADGRITVNILDPLDGGREVDAREDRVEGLIRQYAAWLGKRWVEEPGYIGLRSLRQYFRMPADAGGKAPFS
jgi:amino acid adenylation domain-containing protein